MGFVKALRVAARYNILTPAVLLGAVPAVALLGLTFAAVPAIAATQTVTGTSTNVVIDPGNSLTNTGTINGSGGPAVSNTAGNNVGTIDNSGLIDGTGAGDGIFIDSDVISIHNEAGGTITTDSSTAVHVDGHVGSFTNDGTISSSDSSAVYIGNGVDTFVNNGSINATSDTGVHINGFVNSFTNAGSIDSHDTGVYFNDGVNSFNNSGLIAATSDAGVDFDNGAEIFVNSGTIQGTYAGVYADGFVNSFTNSGKITGTNGYGVELDSGAGTFGNSGTITGTDTGVYSDDFVNTFTNSGTISGDERGVYINSGVNSFDNMAGGVISGGSDEGVRIEDFVNSFSNEGTITSASSSGVYLASGGGTFNNSGTISGTVGVDSDDSLSSFVNSGTITGTDQTGVAIYGGVGTFDNSGKITGGATSSGVYIEQHVNSFTNSGTISGGDYGVDIGGGADTFNNSGTIEATSTTGHAGVYLDNATDFTNSGTISSAADNAVDIESSVASFLNSGTISSSGSNAGERSAIFINGSVSDFENSGTIASTATDGGGLAINGNVTTFTNSGKITTDTNTAVYIDGTAQTVNNSGTIHGETGIAMPNSSNTVLTNSGAIEGTGGTAVQFGGMDNKLVLKTGASFIGEVDFASNTDVLDLSGFQGNLVLDTNGIDPANVVGGSLVAFSGNEVVVADTSGITTSGQQIEDLVDGISGAIDSAPANAVVDNSIDAASGYASTGPHTAATAAVNDAVVAPASARNTVWASAIGGGSSNSSADATDKSTDVYGALIAGTHTTLDNGVELGIVGGYARTSADVFQSNTASDNGILGLYGKADTGTVGLRFQVLGGFSSNTRTRTVSTSTGSETATGSFTGWFIAPQLTASLPVLTTAGGKFSVVGEVGYIGGGFGGYTESGTSFPLTVGSQTIGLLDGSIGLESETKVGSANGGDVTLKGNVAVFGQGNVGSSDTDVSLLGTTVAAVAPSTSAYGVKGGFSFEMPVSDEVTVGAGATAMARSDGQYGGSANVKLVGHY